MQEELHPFLLTNRGNFLGIVLRKKEELITVCGSMYVGVRALERFCTISLLEVGDSWLVKAFSHSVIPVGA